MKQSPSLNRSRDSPFLDCSGFWTQEWLTDELLNAALAFYFLFAIVHSALPAFLQRRRGVLTQTWANHIFPVLALALVLVPVFTLAEVSFIVWPFILLVDLLAIALAVLTATLLPVLAVLLLTIAATGALIFKTPVRPHRPARFISLAWRVRGFLCRSERLAGEKIQARSIENRDQIPATTLLRREIWLRFCPRAPSCFRSCCSSWRRYGCR